MSNVAPGAEEQHPGLFRRVVLYLFLGCQLTLISHTQIPLAVSLFLLSNARRVLCTRAQRHLETAEPAEDHTLSLRRAISTRGTQGRKLGLRHQQEMPIQSPAVSRPKTVWMSCGGPSIPIQSPIQGPSKSRLDGQSGSLDDGPGIPRISRHGVTTGLHGLETPRFQPLSYPRHGAHMPFRARAEDLTNQRRGMAHSHAPPGRT